MILNEQVNSLNMTSKKSIFFKSIAVLELYVVLREKSLLLDSNSLILRNQMFELNYRGEYIDLVASSLFSILEPDFNL